jgi:hypothetical protein
MTPDEMTAQLERMQANAKDVPASLEKAARDTAKSIKAPGVGVAVGRSGEGVVVRVMSANPRASSRQVAARVKPALVSNAKREIEECLRD